MQVTGFLTPQEYVTKRSQLQREMESLQPVDYDDLVEAADLLQNFKKYWEACDNVSQPDNARQQLLAKIVDRIFVYDDHVIAIALHGDFSVVLDNATFAPHEIVEGLRSEIKKGASDSDSTCTRNGSDGYRSLTCITIVFLPKHIVQKHLSQVLNISILPQSQELFRSPIIGKIRQPGSQAAVYVAQAVN